jgi:hypothetical protein
MDASSNKTAFLNYLSAIALENSYASDVDIANAKVPRISANPRNSADNNFRLGHPLMAEHVNFHNAIPAEDELSSDETIAKGNTSDFNNPPAVSTLPSRQASEITYCIIPPEDALSSDEAIATATISNSNNAQTLSATPPRLTNRSSAPIATTTSAMTSNIENDLIFSSISKNQQRFEKLIFINAADYANFSKTDVPLIANTINWHLQFSAQHTPGLDIAIDKRLIKRLLDLGARVNTSDEKEQRNSALWMALQQTDIEVVKLLLEYGCDPNSSCALTTAAQKGALEQLQLLLQYGANPNKPQAGKYALNEACLRGDTAMAKLLLKNHAKVHESRAEMTALMSACISGNVELCVLLIQSGARNHIPTPDQLANFALHMTESHADIEIYELMISLAKAVETDDVAEAENNFSNLLAIAGTLFSDTQDQNAQLTFTDQELLNQFSNHYRLSKMCFSHLAAGASQLQKIHGSLQEKFLNDTLDINMANLFAAAKSRRDGDHLS